jgi:hypothetical protein
MFAVLDVPLILVSSDAVKMPRDFMVINGFIWDKTEPKHKTLHLKLGQK